MKVLNGLSDKHTGSLENEVRCPKSWTTPLMSSLPIRCDVSYPQPHSDRTHVDGPGGKVGNVSITSHQWKYSAQLQNLFRDLIANSICRSCMEDIFIQMELQNIATVERKLEHKIFKLKSSRTLSNTLHSISPKTSMKTQTMRSLKQFILEATSVGTPSGRLVIMTLLVLMLSR